MKLFQIHYFNGDEEIIQALGFENIRSVKRYLHKQNVIGSATIYDYQNRNTYYYKPRLK